MKAKIITLVICTFLFTVTIQSQIKVNTKKAISTTKVVKKSSVGCKQVSNRIVNGILNKSVAKDLEVYLNRENSYVKIMGQKNNISIPERTVQSARKWVYFVNDIKSFKSWSTFDARDRKFNLFIEFEGNGSEIKGKCPGCLKRFRDSRAPDLNWQGKRIAKITLKPIAYDNSVAFNVEKVDLLGKFDLNGPLEAMFPPLIKYFEKRIKDEIEKQAKKALNTPSNKKAMADAMRGTIRFLGLNSVRTVEITGSNLYICD
jgi:hypothetical protein